MKIGLLTISDRSARGERADESGPALRRRIEGLGWQVPEASMVPDEQSEIEAVLRRWADGGQVDVILTTGGTGLSARDCTPEATLAVCDRLVPGLGEALRAEGRRATPHAMLSRALAGVRGRVLIVNLPGSPRGALESLETIRAALAHAVEVLRGDPKAEAGHRRGSRPTT
ncbi:MAG TPA: MogA/MoaB family molybdenum cofactor biosynthesis protein [Anaerolineales bacterium]|nr:MogA/MoaB family molybdenum cofactor biosynthesis protein [Anaerolineales bacterium]